MDFLELKKRDGQTWRFHLCLTILVVIEFKPPGGILDYSLSKKPVVVHPEWTGLLFKEDLSERLS